ncbi:hypothetical protein M0813_21201 [Anaeramoeba flamelloides]|uniref:Uncharacterized protein n=1 Tax=Anaeramoeba flamelloides TaxID=1746091 RepID=A0ABQ8YJE1_9EUKA|nr:hypothetical protein M0813_21201 [Anaeramoeba flamelloides]
MHNYTRILRLLIISKYYYDATGESVRGNFIKNGLALWKKGCTEKIERFCHLFLNGIRCDFTDLKKLSEDDNFGLKHRKKYQNFIDQNESEKDEFFRVCTDIQMNNMKTNSQKGKKRVRNAGKTTLSQPIFTEERFEVRPQSKKKTTPPKKEEKGAKCWEVWKKIESIFTNTDEDEDDILEEWSEDANSDRSGDTKLSKVVLEDNIIGINWRDNLCWFDSVIHSLTFVEGFVDWLKAIDTNEAKMLRAMLVSIRNSTTISRRKSRELKNLLMSARDKLLKSAPQEYRNGDLNHVSSAIVILDAIFQKHPKYKGDMTSDYFRVYDKNICEGKTVVPLAPTVWKITTINCHQLREWLSQTIKYSYYRTYETRQTARYSDKKYYRKKYPKKAKLPKLFRNIYKYTVEEIKKNLKTSFTHSKKIVKYGKIGTYEDRNFGCIRNVGRRNKLIFKTTEKFLSILEIFSIINNPIPLRILRRGENEIEIWDESNKINEYQEIFIKKTQTINQKIKMLKYDQNKVPKFISRGNTPQIESEIYLKIATFNVGGLGKDIKTEAMEMFLYQNNIDIALIQETRKSSSVYLRKYRAISKKSYGPKGNKGGLAILFKPFLKFFITEKLIDHEDTMGINLNDLSIVNCKERKKEKKKKAAFEYFK